MVSPASPIDCKIENYDHFKKGIHKEIGSLREALLANSSVVTGNLKESIDLEKIKRAIEEIGTLTDFNKIIFDSVVEDSNQGASSDSMSLFDGNRKQSMSDSSLPSFHKRDSLTYDQSQLMLLLNYIKKLQKQNDTLAKKEACNRIKQGETREKITKMSEIINNLETSLASARDNRQANCFFLRKTQSFDNLSAFLAKSEEDTSSISQKESSEKEYDLYEVLGAYPKKEESLRVSKEEEEEEEEPVEMPEIETYSFRKTL